MKEAKSAISESLFRDVNEVAATSTDALEIRLLCECPDRRCVGTLLISVEAYESVRRRPRAFVVLPGHEQEDEDVVERYEHYYVVEKLGHSAKVAARLDPRSRSRASSNGKRGEGRTGGR